MRAVLDPNVLISAIIGSGPPADILAAWKRGDFDVIVSRLLIEELTEVLERPKLARRVTASDAAAFMDLLRSAAMLVEDPPAVRRLPDPDDDYLVALAETSQAVLVTGDSDLLSLAPDGPIMSPRDFLERLEPA